MICSGTTTSYKSILLSLLHIWQDKFYSQYCLLIDLQQKDHKLLNAVFSFQANVGDWSGNQWLSMFSSEAEKVLGMTAKEVGEALEADPEAVSTIVDKAHFKQFIFKCRAKMENYNVGSWL